MSSGGAKSERRRKILAEAWVGDAVLALCARQFILREGGVVDAARFERLTSNQFLAALGDPAEVEAEIGRLYESEGLDAAFRMIETRLISLHNKQEIKRLRGLQ